MNKEIIRVRIAELAQKIREKLEGGKLYGDPVDLDDLESLIVAAYCAGQFDVYPRETIFGYPVILSDNILESKIIPCSFNDIAKSTER